VFASPRCGCRIETTYEPFSNVCVPQVKSAVVCVTSMPLTKSQSTRRFASASLRWPAPIGITWASGYSVIQLLATSNGGGQHAGRGAFSAPRM
jgi:hypothetical protein